MKTPHQVPALLPLPNLWQMLTDTEAEDARRVASMAYRTLLGMRPVVKGVPRVVAGSNDR